MGAQPGMDKSSSLGHDSGCDHWSAHTPANLSLQIQCLQMISAGKTWLSSLPEWALQFDIALGTAKITSW